MQPISLGLPIAQLCLTLIKPRCMQQAVKKTTQVLRLSLIVKTLSTDGDAKQTDETEIQY